MIVGIIAASPAYDILLTNAQALLSSRAASNVWYGFVRSFLLAIPCGILMYCAVNAKDTLRLIYIIMCVAGFILGGFYHCIADIFYTLLAGTTWQPYVNLLFVTMGNILGCNLIPVFKRYI